ncbi:MAG TPA: pyruvate kinase [Thermoplasmata archaeon]|nr:pyruvate kinase [Thermoplasmata archaeon]
MKGWSRAKRTKIVCTLGPASSTPRVVEAMIREGMDVARLNFSHGTRAEHARVARLVRRLSDRVGRPVAVLGDLAGPRIRVGRMAADTVLRPKSRVTVTPRDVIGDEATVPISYRGLARDVRRGDLILLADGSLELRVDSRRGRDLQCRVLVGGPLASHKGVNVPSRALSLPSLTEKDANDLRFAVAAGFDVIAQSFVRSPKDIAAAKAITRRAGRDTPIIAKVECQGALDRLEAIIDAADGVMVARGDLGVEIPLARVPAVQKRIIHLANARAKPVITATQMLESMVDTPRPTRAEAADVYNAILDGTDAVMLSEESAVGRHPVESVRTLASIAREAEAALRLRPGNAEEEVKAAVAAAAVELAEDLGAAAILTPTSTGRTPRAIARHRPRQPILALTADPHVLRALTLVWGVVPVAVRGSLRLDGLVGRARGLLREEGLPRAAPVVLTMGYPRGKGLTNMVLVVEA